MNARELPRDGRVRLARLALALAGLIVFYAGVLATHRLDLHPDEAQYAVWSRDLAFGYYSKPPMIAWSIRAMRGLCGEGEACVRFTATLLQAGAACFVAWAGTRLAGAHVGVMAAFVYATLPMTVFSSLFVTTDAPVCFFSAAALAFAIGALRTDRWRDWLALGVCFGLGLMSKYSMAFAVLAWWLYLAASPETRSRLLSAKHLAALVLALALFAPNLAWNAAHGFPTVAHTAEISQLDRPRFALAELGLFLLGQVGALGPVLAFVLARGILVKPRRVAEEPFRLPAIAFLLPLLLFAALAAVARANANWTAFALPAAALLVVLLARADARLRMLRTAIIVNLAIAVGFALLPYALRATPVELKGRWNPAARLAGWHTLGDEVAVRLRASPELLLMTDERLAAAELLYYARPQALVIWNPSGRVTDHFRLMNDVAARPGADVLFVTRATDPAELRGRFATVDALPTIVVAMGRETPVEFRVYRATGFKGYRAP
jgi:4-amino-4-deoxy-L-arabinose transferase-like glycosyltransferase